MNKQKVKPKSAKEVRKDTVSQNPAAGTKPIGNVGAQGDFGGE
jgi:hypothetical protein